MARTANKAKAKKAVLARPGDPYVLSDGTKIPPSRPRIEVEDDTKQITVAEFRPRDQRSVRDLPATPSVVSGIACVLVYSILGLGNRDIADAMNCSLDAVERAKEHESYEEIFGLIRDEIINANSENIMSRIAAYQGGALTSLAGVAFNGKMEGNKMRASMDILNRGGSTSKQHVGIDGANDLRIIITEGETSVEVNVGNLGGT